MRIQASTILSFVTGRLYSNTPPTVLFADLCETITGEKSIQTIAMHFIKDKLKDKIIAQLPKELAAICTDWQHSDDWQNKVSLIDETFGKVEIKYCA